MSIYFLFSPGETTIKFQFRKHDLISAALWKVSIFKQCYDLYLLLDKSE